MNERLARLNELRQKAFGELEALKGARKAITDKVEAEQRQDLTEGETVAYRAKGAEIKAKQEQVLDLEDQIRELEEEIARAGRMAPADMPRTTVSVTSVKEPLTYQRGNGKSYLQDLAHMAVGQADDDMKQRLYRHATDVRDYTNLRKSATGAEARALDRTDTTGGYFTPPVWLMEQFIELARAGRPYANLVKTLPLPPGTDSINIPKIDTGTSTAIQTADNATISETDAADTSVQANVKTIAGAQGVSIQQLEQSPLAFDEIIFSDLARDFNAKLDVQVISGSGSNNQVRGVRNTSNIITVTATDAGTELSKAQTIYKKIADGIQRIHTQRFQAPEVIVMHPRRWAAFTALFDGDDRPLLITAGPGVNQIGEFGGVVSQQIVGTMHGLPVVTDPNLPITLGAGTNEDVVHVLVASDLLLWEGPLRMRSLQETRAENLTVLLQVYGFLAFTAGRQPKSVCEIGGSACTSPTFA